MNDVPTVNAASNGARYLVTLSAGTHEWPADEPAALGGADRGPTPHHLLLSALGACTAITLRMYAERKGWALQEVQVELQFNPEGKPAAGGSDIRRRITLHGVLDPQQRERLLQIANACPIHKVLSGPVRIATSLA
ncbi:MAG: OsmC family protein [Steroidobacteraceae bacterium]